MSRDKGNKKTQKCNTLENIFSEMMNTQYRRGPPRRYSLKDTEGLCHTKVFARKTVSQSHVNY